MSAYRHQPPGANLHARPHRAGGPPLPTSMPAMSTPGGTPRPGLNRGKTLVRPDRAVAAAPLINPGQSAGQPAPGVGALGAHTATSATSPGTTSAWYSPWPLFVTIVTLFVPGFMLRWAGLKDPVAQQAWREKVTLCFIIATLGAGVAFVTVGLRAVLCPDTATAGQGKYTRVNSTAGFVAIDGYLFNVSSATGLNGVNFIQLATQLSGHDASNLFDRTALTNAAPCAHLKSRVSTSDLCANASSPNAACVFGAPSNQLMRSLGLVNASMVAGYAWGQVSDMPNYMVYDGTVLNMASYLAANPKPDLNDIVDVAIRRVLLEQPADGGRDATKLFSNSKTLKDAAKCMQRRYIAGHIDKISPGCFVSQLFLYASLVVILSVVMSRFVMALVFSWFLSSRLIRPPSSRHLKRKVVSPAVLPVGANISVGNTVGAAPWAGGRKSEKKVAGKLIKEQPTRNGSLVAPTSNARVMDSRGQITMGSIGAELFCVCLVTCYSEGEEGIRATLDSIAGSTYSDARKLLFVVCDGMITGSGEAKSTPDICVEMIDADPRFGNPQPMSYRAVASGSKEHNQAMVYAGHYTNVKGHRTPTIVVVKCGTAGEANDKKPGNRGKRDSQMVLMNFFSRVTYNDRMSPLDYDLFRKMQALMGVTPDFFEVCLMVDADTKVFPDALTHLVNCMQHDPYIMGVCGETRIANKRQSWVTAIQVYEYYISHHLAKAFESVFGGVTCLPGCFSMYRLKARKTNGGDWVPILAQPEICREYSQSVVTTLHQKNLLLLGEDRFLTTLMIRAFPARKMMFCPQARCRTIAPDEFKVLLSQRRRWINSTIHNLLELVKVPNLCGTFCFSMQFVVFMDLLGTVVLPVAICLTYTLVVNYILNPPKSFGDAIPLLLLGAVLGLPAILIMMTSRKIIYVFWMGVYLLALPVWNFVLPVYSFWHFDDFSWGETRKVQGEAKGAGHDETGEAIGANAVPLRRWEDWERSRLRKQRREDKRRKEFERAFGTRQYHSNGSDAAETASVLSSSEGDDRWGMAIGNYNENEVSVPAVGLYEVDDSFSDGNTLKGDELEQMLNAGWGDDDSLSPSPSSKHEFGPFPGGGGTTRRISPPSPSQYVTIATSSDHGSPGTPREIGSAGPLLTRTPAPHSSGLREFEVDPMTSLKSPGISSAVEAGWQSGHTKRRSGGTGGR